MQIFPIRFYKTVDAGLMLFLALYNVVSVYYRL